MTTLYDFTVSNQADQLVSLHDYKGKVVLIVNTATGCGLTPQYQGLQELYDKYKDQGFEILDFPCNQFMGQAPGSAEEINTFCTLNYHTTFPRLAKIKVNGKEAEPLFDWLKQEKSGPLGARIEWNFAKFLINREGQVVERFSSKTDPLKMEDDIKALLSN
ncbi:redoxin domain-containing protein [Streptococcus salivarius]|uniref:glutathione peroxidase n=1 Tax=Streptococcus salivarius TaxID=1304 RepID=UPI0012BC43BE|nr:glutathione peroxidase [Streptococcus salivarius]MTR23940.1 redoxin domain-containing protein [Streptococcus salivarius]MTR43119.1 redoxin domain-containing protein [Streptococcus salivarius]